MTPDDRFRVLVVDDRRNMLNAARSQLASGALAEDVHLELAQTVVEAQEMIDRSCFDLAMVDLRLQDDNSESGRAVVEHLLRHAPSCEVVVISAYVKEEESAVLNLVSPLADVLIPVLLKNSGENLFRPLVAERVARWKKRLLRLDGLDQLVDVICKDERVKRLHLATRGNRDAVKQELVRLFVAMFGGALPRVDNEPSDGLRLEHIHQGLSASTVVEVVPLLGREALGTDVLGNRCIVKIGRRQDVKAEVDRFNSIVKYGVPTGSRVELLDYAYCDKLAAVCYSFAGGSSTPVTTLESVVQADPQGLDGKDTLATVMTCIRSLFSTETRQWYQVRGAQISPGHFVDSSLSAKLTLRSPHRDRRIEKSVHALGGNFDPATGKAVIGGVHLRFPTQEHLGSGELQLGYPSCLVHGDMHAGNIMLDSEHRVRLIDFAQAGLGPRPIDAAVLSGSIRAWDAWRAPRTNDREEVERWLAERLQRERAITDNLWAEPSARSKAWEVCVRQLHERLRDNFEDMTDSELIVCTLLQATRLLTLPVDDPRFALRLGAWLTPLVEWIEKQDKGSGRRGVVTGKRTSSSNRT